MILNVKPAQSRISEKEDCNPYKAIKTDLLKSIPLRSNDFRFEVEIAFKLAKRRARVFEAPIRYLPRTREEGKKIRARDGLDFKLKRSSTSIECQFPSGGSMVNCFGERSFLASS